MTIPLWLIITIASTSGALMGAGAVLFVLWAFLVDAFPPERMEG